MMIPIKDKKARQIGYDKKAEKICNSRSFVDTIPMDTLLSISQTICPNHNLFNAHDKG
jgi:hypothetical protein